MTGLLTSVAVLVVGVVWLVGRVDGEPEESSRPAPAATAAVLHELTRALTSADLAAVDRLAVATSPRTAALLGDIIDNVTRLRLTEVSWHLDDDLDHLAEDRWRASTRLGWSMAGVGRSSAEVVMTFAEDADGSVRIVGIGESDAPVPLWLTGPVQRRQTGTTLVLSAAGRLDRYTRLARAAVPTVRRVLPGWRGPLVLEVPASAEDLDRVLGKSAGHFADIAAVTTVPPGVVDGPDGSGTPGPKQRHVFVNPEILESLETLGRQVVISHEATHVAVGETPAAMPLWLVEGFADHVALRDVALPQERATAQIVAQVRRTGVPERLPGSEEFDAASGDLGATYEGSWQACEVIVAAAGEAALVGLHDRVQAGEALGTVLRSEVGFGIEELTRRWQQRLRELAR